MKVLAALQYYLPHRSGYTLHVQRVAEALAARGHEVHVLTARHRPDLPSTETIAGVRVSRIEAPLRISRGAVMPSYPFRAWRAAGAADVVWISSPLLETSLWALVSGLRGKRLVITHHGDLHLPSGSLNRFIEAFTLANYRLAARTAQAIIAYSSDYAHGSRWLAPYAAKVRVIHPPIVIPRPEPAAVAACRRELNAGAGPIIGFAGRFAQEKRPDLLLRAAVLLREHHPGLRVVFAGEHRLAYEDTFARCNALIEEAKDLVTFLGLIEEPQRLANYYAACDVLALPSDTECFALVQVEAMLCGTPVVASDIPGGRVPVVATGMGRLFEAGNAQALADALDDVLRDRTRFIASRERVESVFSLARTADAYEAILAGPLTAECEARGLSNRPQASGDHTSDRAAAGGIGALVAAELDPAYRRRVETVVEWLPPSADPRSHIVDIGCGRGYFAHYYATLGQHAITGVEIDAVIARRAAATHASQPRVAIVRADAAALPLGAATCSGAILSEVLEHVSDDAAVLRETLRVLRAGAIAAITVPHVNFPWAWDPINRTLQSMRLQPVRKGPLAGIWAGHVRLYDIDTLRRIVQGAGFVIEEERAMVRHCLPFSHNLLYGIGKPLLESGWLPATMAGAIDRARSPDAGSSPIAACLRRLLALGDGRNRLHEGFDVPSVGLAIKARKPG